MRLYVNYIFVIFLLSSCNREVKTFDQMKGYQGPMRETDSIQTRYSENAIIKVIIKAAKQIDFDNGKIQYPKGIHIDFHNDEGVRTSTLDANYGEYFPDTKQYLVRGNVVINSTLEKRAIRTEELYWDAEELPAKTPQEREANRKKRIHTDKFVQIETDREFIQGTGLEASDDFSYHRINNISGVISK